MVEKIKKPLICTLQVLHHEDHRRRAGELFEEDPPPGEQLLPPEVGTGCTDADQAGETGKDVFPQSGVRHELDEAGGKALAGDRGRVLLGDPESLAHHLRQGPEGDHVPVGEATPPVPPHRRRQTVDVLLELPAETGLTHSRRSAHGDEARRPAVHAGVERLFQHSELGVAAGKGGFEPVETLRATETREHLLGPPQPHRPRLPLQIGLTGVREADRPPRHAPCGLVHEDRAGRSDALYPGRRVDRVAEHHSLGNLADRDRHLARDDAGPSPEVGDVGVPPEILDGANDVEGCPDGPLGVAFGRHRRAQIAITASPMNFSTTPPKRAITVWAASKYRERSSRTSSGSCASASGVKPTRSTNRTEQTRRSASGTELSADTVVVAWAAREPCGSPSLGVSRAPQMRQKGFPSDNAAPHAAHVRPTGVPQFSQKRLSSGRSHWQDEQRKNASISPPELKACDCGSTRLGAGGDGGGASVVFVLV